jgi:hypothetical protein
MILASYDGSADARAALDHVAQLMPGAEVTVLTVWEPFQEALSRTGGMGLGAGSSFPTTARSTPPARKRHALRRARAPSAP